MSPKKSAATSPGSVAAAPALITPPVPEVPPTETAAPVSCCKCGAEMEKDARPRYCKECRSNYQRDYNALQSQMAANKGYEMGVKTFRAMMAAEFARHGKVAFSGSEVAAAIEHAPRPPWPAA